MTSPLLKNLRALPAMTDAEAMAAFGLDRIKSLLANWQPMLDEICRFEAALHSEEHVKLDAVIAENAALKEEIQQLTNALGEAIMGQPKR